MDKSGETILRLRSQNKKLRDSVRELRRQIMIQDEAVAQNNRELHELRRRRK